MLKQVSFTIILTLFLLDVGFAQTRSFCGMSTADLKVVRNNLIENKAFLKKHSDQAASRNAVTYVPVKFHLVGKDDGSGRIDYNAILDQICLLNETFADFDFQFYIFEGFNELNSTAVYENSQTTDGELKMQQEQEPRAINIFILEEAQISQNIENQTLGYYHPDFDWVVVEKKFTSRQGYTMIHEMGHFFSLLHPFHGWGDEGASPYDKTYEGKPAPIMSPEPANILNEYADGSNCEIAGDMVCDTPADYLYFEQMDNINCRYTKPMLDPKGEQLRPDPTLIMGYFLDGCVDKFTPQQVALMKADLQNARRVRLRSNYIPVSSPIVAPPALIAPANNEVTDSYNKVRLSWQGISNAKYYLVEIEKVPTFGFNSLRFLTSNASILIDDILEPDRKYFWRVRPFNEVYTCGGFSALGRFKTGIATAIETIENVNNWEVYPNPVRSADGLMVSVHANAAFEATIKVFDLAGKLLFSKPNQLFLDGSTQHRINIASLAPGMYFIHIENQEGILNKKIIVQ